MFAVDTASGDSVLPAGKKFLYYHDPADQSVHICKPNGIYGKDSILDFRMDFDINDTALFKEKVNYLKGLFENPHVAFINYDKNDQTMSRSKLANNNKTVIYIDNFNNIHVKSPYGKEQRSIKQIGKHSIFSIKEFIRIAIATKAPDLTAPPTYAELFKDKSNMKIINYETALDIPHSFFKDDLLKYLIYRTLGKGENDSVNYRCYKLENGIIYRSVLTVKNAEEMQKLVNSSFTDSSFEVYQLKDLARAAGINIIDNWPIGGKGPTGDWSDEFIVQHYDTLIPMIYDSREIPSVYKLFAKTGKKDELGKDNYEVITIDQNISSLEFYKLVQEKLGGQLEERRLAVKKLEEARIAALQKTLDSAP